jgi:hypothetical protein
MENDRKQVILKNYKTSLMPVLVMVIQIRLKKKKIRSRRVYLYRIRSLLMRLGYVSPNCSRG